MLLLKSVATAATLAILLADVSVSEPIATIEPCTEAPGLKLHPVTVTSQFQPVSTCQASTACIKGQCTTIFPFTTFPYVSTVVPYAWNGTTTQKTTVTAATQPFRVSEHLETLTTITAGPTAGRPGWVDWIARRKGGPKSVTVYETVTRRAVAPFNECGPLAIPGWSGSGVCEKCSELEDGSRSQLLDVVECRYGVNGAGKQYQKCAEWFETIISRPAPTSTVTASALCSSKGHVPGPGTYTWTFPQTAPPVTITAPPRTVTITVHGRKTITVEPKHVYTIPGRGWDACVTRSFTAAGDFQFNIVITKVIIFNIPNHTRPAGSTRHVPVPTGSVDKNGNGWWPLPKNDKGDDYYGGSNEWADWAPPIKTSSTTTRGGQTWSYSSSTSSSLSLGPIDQSTTSDWTSSTLSSTISTTSSFSISLGPIDQSTTTTSSVSTISTSSRAIDSPIEGSTTVSSTSTDTESSTLTTSTSTLTDGPIDQSTTASSTSTDTESSTLTTSTSTLTDGPIDQSTTASSTSTDTESSTLTTSTSTLTDGPIDQTTTTSSIDQGSSTSSTTDEEPTTTSSSTFTDVIVTTTTSSFSAGPTDGTTTSSEPTSGTTSPPVTTTTTPPAPLCSLTVDICVGSPLISANIVVVEDCPLLGGLLCTVTDLLNLIPAILSGNPNVASVIVADQQVIGLSISPAQLQAAILDGTLVDPLVCSVVQQVSATIIDPTCPINPTSTSSSSTISSTSSTLTTTSAPATTTTPTAPLCNLSVQVCPGDGQLAAATIQTVTCPLLGGLLCTVTDLLSLVPALLNSDPNILSVVIRDQQLLGLSITPAEVEALALQDVVPGVCGLVDPITIVINDPTCPINPTTTTTSSTSSIITTTTSAPATTTTSSAPVCDLIVQVCPGNAALAAVTIQTVTCPLLGGLLCTVNDLLSLVPALLTGNPNVLSVVLGDNEVLGLSITPEEVQALALSGDLTALCGAVQPIDVIVNDPTCPANPTTTTSTTVAVASTTTSVPATTTTSSGDVCNLAVSICPNSPDLVAATITTVQCPLLGGLLCTVNDLLSLVPALLNSNPNVLSVVLGDNQVLGLSLTPTEVQALALSGVLTSTCTVVQQVDVIVNDPTCPINPTTTTTTSPPTVPTTTTSPPTVPTTTVVNPPVPTTTSGGGGGGGGGVQPRCGIQVQLCVGQTLQSVGLTEVACTLTDPLLCTLTQVLTDVTNVCVGLQGGCASVGRIGAGVNILGSTGLAGTQTIAQVEAAIAGIQGCVPGQILTLSDPGCAANLFKRHGSAGRRRKY